MKFSMVPSLLLPLLAAAAPVAPENPPFSVMATRSASPIHFLPMTASGQKFYLGGETTSYCPIGEGCPPGNQTVFAPGGYGMNVMVPGGQQVYVDPKGALSFTQAHSAYIPEAPPWVPSTTSPARTGATTPSTAGVFAAVQNATVPKGNVAECLGFNALANTAPKEAAAWQYV
ncbi:IgE-binding protein [Aspergillus nomiae NRRL 13137]|uniref:IgE-binding protein n=1 Tax=Aspergillus nomiae NRRL (strain ATCC 15546 / NRRL 13137 / CBS 260.88 / M93) TaxID=1509407 RepID=A0A0L1J5E1_ASPN3|nr:IgE-binding protein [Aspergillus nomiae NRRL 13137]KNG87036.1 IgE-binding protein [Aspergillus nomiae NRRL 13137]